MLYQSDLCPSCHITFCLLLLCLLTAHYVMKYGIIWRTIWNENVTFCDTHFIKTPILQVTDNISISSEYQNECLRLLYGNLCLWLWVKVSFQVNGSVSHYFECKWDCLILRIISSHNIHHSDLLYAVSSEIYSLVSPFSGANGSDLVSIVACTRNCWRKTWIKTSTHSTHQLYVRSTPPVPSFFKRFLSSMADFYSFP